MLKEKDLKQIETLGIGNKEIERLLRPALKNDGLFILNKSEEIYFENYYRDNKEDFSISKFVPASGAASRMFKDLLTFFNNFDAEKDDFKTFVKENKLNSIIEFFDKLKRFAFYSELMDLIEKSEKEFATLTVNEKYMIILDFLLTEKGLNYGNKPKGLLAFHFYQSKYRTAVSEHLVEGARYAMESNRTVNIHFTISEEHREWFENLINKKVKKYESDFHVKYNIDYSYQSSSTDTIAVSPENEPFRDKSGNIIFRPGGHGALINNLNTIDQEIVFIKNIDNVVPDHLKEVTIKYKRIIGGILLNVNRVINSYQSRLVTGDYTDVTIEAIEKFLSKELSIVLPKSYYKLTFEEKVNSIKEIINRPVRVCGMVKNEGEPGGGPFWTKSPNGNISLQIVEGAQIDLNNKEQADIVASSTHFNPVDIVCAFKDWSGKSLNLDKYVDESTGFISEKSKDGKDLKALERPGLWNGAMSGWITIFVEVPIITFNPVKTINDLLRPEHQSLATMNKA